MARAVLGRAAPDWYARLPSPEAICRRIVGDLIAAGRIPPPAWRCRGIFQGTAIAERVRQEWQANDAGVPGLPPIAIRPFEPDRVAVEWCRTAWRQDGTPFATAGPAGAAPEARACTRTDIRGSAFRALCGIADRLGTAPATVLAAAVLVALWRFRNAPELPAETLQIAMLSDASPLLGLNRSGLMQRKIDLSANRSFATLVGMLEAPTGSAQEDGAVDACLILRRPNDGGIVLGSVSLLDGPIVPVIDVAAHSRGVGVEWTNGINLRSGWTGDDVLEVLAPLLHAAAALLSPCLAELPLVERFEQAAAFGGPASPGHAGGLRPVIATIVEQATRTPDAIAIESGSAALTYRALIARVGAIAARLTAMGACPERPVAVCLDRTPDLVAALLAVHWVGAAYVPLDPEHPLAHRVEKLLASGATLVVTQRAGDLAGGPVTALPLDDIPPAAVPASTPMPGPLAYVIFTSGSTGRPKGVAVGQPALANLIATARDRLGFGASDILLAVTTPAFDIAALELFLPLTVGARVALASRDTVRDGYGLAQALAATGATVMQATPATWTMLVESGWTGAPHLRALCGGEALGPALAARILERVGALWNLYGPTEATVWATAQAVDRSLLDACRDDPSLPIGEPLANLDLAILDDRLVPVPDGMTGELFLSGIGLADGYVGDAALTAERFPLVATAPGQYRRFYRTGDLVRRRNGRIFFLSRRDTQVKLHGHRIELVEIECHIREMAGVSDAVAMRPDDLPGGPGLVAYVVASDAPIGAESLRGWLASRLPAYMVPHHIVFLHALPLGPTGKIDVKALPPPHALDAERQNAAPPRNDTERRLLLIWSDLLELPGIGIQDRFFDLNGHSLAAAEMFVRIAQTFGVSLPVRILAEASTIADLAAAIDAARAGAAWPMRTAAWRKPLLRDAILPDDVRPPSPGLKPVTGDILLTGATGFLGGQLLAQLLVETPARVHCLARGDAALMVRNRIRDRLIADRAWRPEWEDRLIVHLGDLELDRLGLDKSSHAGLADDVGQIYHCAAQVAFTLPYRHLRQANVVATANLLRFACSGRAKTFHHISTTSVFDQVALFDGRTIDEDAIAPLTGEPLTGYAASKWVAEQLVLAARARGLAATVYRPGTISGDSRTGVWPTHDLIPATIKGCIELSAVPDIDLGLPLTPVDLVARAIVAVAAAGIPDRVVFHPVCGHVVTLRDITRWLHRHGYRLERLPYDGWRARLRARLQRGEANAIGALASIFLDPLPDAGGMTAPELLTPGRRPVFRNDAVAAVMGAGGLSSAGVDEALFSRYISWWQGTGYLPKPCADMAPG